MTYKQIKEKYPKVWNKHISQDKSTFGALRGGAFSLNDPTDAYAIIFTFYIHSVAEWNNEWADFFDSQGIYGGILPNQLGFFRALVLNKEFEKDWFKDFNTRKEARIKLLEMCFDELEKQLNKI